MKELFKEVIAKKLRKRGADYQLSANSVLSGTGFGDMSKLASRLYRAMQAINPWLTWGEVYRRLLRILVTIRTKNLNMLKEGKIGYTHVHLLNGFRLSKRIGWDSLLAWNPIISLDIPDRQVHITLPEDKKGRLRKFPERSVQLGITFYVVVADLENPSKVLYQRGTKTALISPEEDPREQKVKIPLEFYPKSLILVIGTAQYHLGNTINKDIIASNHSLDYATDILQTFHVQDDQLLMEYKEKEPKKMIFPEPIVGDIEWE